MDSAAENMPRSQCKKGVQSLWEWSITWKNSYPFPQQLAPLRWLTEKINSWNWNHKEKKAWRNLKKVLTEEAVLKFYDAKRPIRISSDASQEGLGAVLLHNKAWLPVAYASCLLSDPETRYAQIQKKSCLASSLFARDFRAIC